MTDIAHHDIDIAPRDLDIALAILAEHAPGCEARVFGSRADGTAREFSDIDIALVGETPLGRDALGVVKEAFQESDMHIRADILDWHALSDSFKEIVSRNYIVIQRPAQTRAGLPGGWRETTLGDCAIISNETYSPKEDWPFVNYLDTGNITDNRVSEIQRLTAGKDKIPSRARRKVRDGDIVYSTVRPNQRHYGIIRNPPDNFLASTGFAVMRGMPDIADTGFIYSFLTQSHIVEHLHGLAEQNVSAYPSIRPQDIAELELPLPPLPEQRRIAGILGALDDKIALNRRMSATLEGMAQALFKAWFVDFEPVRAKMSGRWRRGESLAGMPAELWDAFPAGLAAWEAWEAPEGWGVRELREVVGYLRQNESPFKEPDTIFTHFSIPAYDAGQMPKKELGAEIKSAKSRVPAGSVLISRINPDIERVWLVDALSEERAVCSTEFMVLGATSHIGRCYIYCLGKSASFRQRLNSLVTGTSKSHQRAPARDALSIEIVVPPKPVADAFESIASEFLTRALANRRESQTLVALRDALLPQLLSGEFRVEG